MALRWDIQTWGKASLFQIQPFKILATKGIGCGRGGGVKPSHRASHKAQNEMLLLRSAAKETVMYLGQGHTYNLLLGILSPLLGTLVIIAGFLQKTYFCSRDPLCAFTQLELELDYKAAFCSRIPLAVHELFRQSRHFSREACLPSFNFLLLDTWTLYYLPEIQPCQDVHSWWDGSITAAAISTGSQKHQELKTPCLKNRYFGQGAKLIDLIWRKGWDLN